MVEGCRDGTSRSLLITPVMPDPNGTGRAKRAHQWLTALEAIGDVDVIWLDAGSGDDDRGVGGRGILLRLHPETARWRRWAQRLVPRQIWPALPPSGWAGPSDRDCQQIRACLDGRLYGRVVCFRLYLAEYAAVIAEILRRRGIELDLDDIESETLTSIAGLYERTGHPLMGLETRFTANRYRHAEERWLPWFDRVHVCSEEDRDRLGARFPGLGIEVFPNRLWRSMVPAEMPAPASALRVLFVGALSYRPNLDAVRRFAQQVLPLLRRGDPRWVFAVAGRGVPGRLKDLLERLPGVEFLGELDDLAPAYAEAGIVVAPLRAGGGTSLKVLEALAHGRPLVATGKAVRGLALQAGRDYLAAESDEDFAGQCRMLGADPELAGRIATAGYQAVRDRYRYGEPL